MDLRNHRFMDLLEYIIKIKIREMVKMKKLSFMQMTKLGKVLKYRELNLLQEFELEEQHRLYKIFENDEEEFKQEFRRVAVEFRDAEEVQKETQQADKSKDIQDKVDVSNEKTLAKQGVYNPSDVLLKAMSSNGTGADFGKWFTGIGSLTLNPKDQMIANFFKVVQKQLFLVIAQQDEQIKLLKQQNEKLIEQNDQMIELMKQIANK